MAACNLPLTAFLVKRFLFPGRFADRTLPTLALLSIACVAISVAALVWAASIRNGIEREVVQRLIHTLPEIEIQRLSAPADASAPVSEAPDLADLKGVRQLDMYRRGSVALAHSLRVAAVELLIVPSLDALSPFDVRAASVASIGSRDRIEACVPLVIGDQLAQLLHLHVGDVIDTIATVRDAKGPAGSTRTVKAQVVRIVRSGNPLYDRHSVLAASDAVQLLGAAPERFWVARTTDPPDTTAATEARIRRRLGNRYSVRSWEDVYAAFSQTLRLQRQVMMAVVGIASLLAALAVASLLYASSAIKGLYFAVLTTVGAEPLFLLWTIIGFAVAVDLLGTMAGTLTGIGLAVSTQTILALFSEPPVLGSNAVAFLPANAPALVSGQDILVIAASSLVLTLGAALLPAVRLAALSPAAILRGER